MVTEGYKVAQVGYLSGRDVVTKAQAHATLNEKLGNITPKFNLKRPGKPWGPPRTQPDAIGRAFEYVDTHDVGHRLKIRGSNEDQPIFVLMRAVELLGKDVVDAGLSQLGVWYVFGDINPRGPAGGPGEGFDCSGFTEWCYLQVHVTLAHQAEAQRVDPQVVNFNLEAKCEPGDLVFMWFPNTRGIAPGHASHVGLWLSNGRVLDTRNPYDEPVAIRTLDMGSVVSFGRVPRVNGPLAA